MLAVQINSFSYTNKSILKNLNFTVDKGEVLAILGESGCGKTTLLHLIYGLLQLEDGTLFWNDTQLMGPSHNLVPGELFMKLVAQEFNIMPFTTVAENVAEHLERVDLKKDDKRVNTLLNVLDLTAYKNTKVKNLSGGQKQRVAIAKALANNPEILLLDEPFSDIDTFKKNTLRRKLFKYLKENNCTCLIATHDAEEALAFSNKLMILKNGASISFGKTEEVYKNITTAYEAGFFGDYSNLPETLVGKKIVFANELTVTTDKTPLQVTVQQVYFQGAHYLIEGLYQTKSVYFHHNKPIKVGKKIFLSLK